jgi:hypothetical protein
MSTALAAVFWELPRLTNLAIPLASLLASWPEK